MLRLIKIAITGFPCSGKTQVCQLFQEQGAFVINTDIITHQLFTNKDIKEMIARRFGPEILKHNHVDRKKIAEIVFSDPQKLKTLESILHPRILHEIENIYQTCPLSENHKYFVVEVPLLFEAGWQKYFDITIFISADEYIRRERFKQRATMNFFSQRQARHIAAEEKRRLADYTLINEGTIHELQSQFHQILHQINTIRTSNLYR